MKNPSIFFFLVLMVSAFACQKDDNNTDIQFVTPKNFPTPVYDFNINPVTNHGFALGRRLFYDPIFSRDSTISCGDCHISYSAFSHTDHKVSHGIDGLLGRRNAPAIQNMAWRTNFFWDGGVPHLDLVPLNAIQNPVEMDDTPGNVVAKLNRHPQYPALFKQAFGSQDTITGAQMLQALSQFMNMLVSANSPYDKYIRQENPNALSADALAGLQLFQQKCASCHQGELFTDQTFRNNGILASFDIDKGRFEITTFPEDIGKFAVQSLRNIEKSAPYMHNGKFPTLQSVLDHYADGVKDSPTLDPLLKQGGTLGIVIELTKTKSVSC